MQAVRASSSRVCVVTGANRGIGREIARQLAARGDIVVLTARDGEKARGAAREQSEQAGDVVAHELDITDPMSARRLAEFVRERWGRVDVLVNNAGIGYDPGQRAATVDLGVVREALETNLLGAWQVTQGLLALLRASRRGRIVNVSSVGGSLTGMTSGGAPAYRVSKAALNALSRLLAADLQHDRILVNSVCPGWTATDLGGPGGQPVAAGAAGVMWAINLPDTGPTGGFYENGRALPW